MLKCNFTCQLKIIFCHSLNNVFWGYTNWLKSGRFFFLFFSEMKSWVTLGFHSIQGATRHPCTHRFPLVPAGQDSQMTTVILSNQETQLPPCSLPFQPGHWIQILKSSSCYWVAIQYWFSVEWQRREEGLGATHKIWAKALYGSKETLTGTEQSKEKSWAGTREEKIIFIKILGIIDVHSQETRFPSCAL